MADQNTSSEHPNMDDGSSTQSWMDESKWAFIQENWGLICDIASRWRNGPAMFTDRDETEHAAMMLAVNCLRTWDPSRGEFSTYFYRAAKGHYKYIVNNKYYNGFGNVLSLHHEDESSPRKAVRGTWSENERNKTVHVDRASRPPDEIALDNVMSQQLRDAIMQLPDELKRHAIETIHEQVDWSDVGTTVELRNQTLEALREAMDADLS